MVLFVKAVGILMLCLGVLVMARPAVFKEKILPFWLVGKRVYIAAVIRLVFGVLFIWAAHLCAFPNIILALGVILLLSGIVIFLGKPEKWLDLIRWWQTQTDTRVRLLSLLPITFGILIIYSA